MLISEVREINLTLSPFIVRPDHLFPTVLLQVSFLDLLYTKTSLFLFLCNAYHPDVIASLSRTLSLSFSHSSINFS